MSDFADSTTNNINKNALKRLFVAISGCKMFSGFKKGFFLFSLITSFPFSTNASEPNYTTFDTPRFTLYVAKADDNDAVYTKNIANTAIEVLNQSTEEYSKVFKTKINNKVVLRFLTPAEFKKSTGAPEWTSAMFYRGEISIPLRNNKSVNINEMKRALKHEYAHAIIADLSNFRCPAWLDEGMAQILEGQVNPVLGPALRNWVAGNELLPLSWLMNGFTSLENKLVPVAYAQSLFATRKIIEEKGFETILEYLKLLKNNSIEKEAFEKAFKTSKKEFMRNLHREALAWARSEQVNP